MRDRWLYGGIAVLALGAGAVFWTLDRSEGGPKPTPPTIGPAAVYAATFTDEAGRPQPLGQFQGRVVLVNFWATWCAPCREEMPALDAAARRWADKGVTVVGLSSEPHATVEAFRREHPSSYPLWTGDAVDDLARRLGDTAGVLPYSVVLGRDGKVLEQRVGPYSAEMLDRLFAKTSQNVAD